MTILEKMKKSEGKRITIYFKDGDIWENKRCDDFLRSEDEDEENMIIIDNVYGINESEIEDIEILDN